MKKLTDCMAALCGAILSFVSGIPPILWVLTAMMSLDLVSGLAAGALGKSDNTPEGGLSSRAALRGLMKKGLILLVVLLAALLDRAVALSAGVQFDAVTGATCLWFIASEGLSVLENAAQIGVPIPKVLRQALEALKEQGAGEK
ncbi:MAG: phage holin family protein [Clostridia bacterium]|nr:phage holin family protein [Clostridia bacterium]